MSAATYGEGEGRARYVGIARVVAGAVVIGVLLFTYSGRVRVGDGNPFDYFGYFTNLTSLLMSVVLLLVGVLTARGIRVSGWLTEARAVGTACLLVVAVVYNVLVPGTGSAPAWASAVLHVVFPSMAALDWLVIGDRPALPWRRLWVVFPYPVLWLVVVLVRGVTDGWVPYGFLLPERGALPMLLTVVGLLAALMVAAALVWAGSRTRGIRLLGVTRVNRGAAGSAEPAYPGSEERSSA